MFRDKVLNIIKKTEKDIDLLQQRLFYTQAALNESYQRQWAAINQLIKAGLWDEDAVYPGNSYGLKVGHETYVFQLDAPLPFLPNVFYRSFKRTYNEFYTTKTMLTLQLRDVIEQIGDGSMKYPAALHVRHYYKDVKIFDLDNKSKQVLINTFRQILLANDTVNCLTGYYEDAVYNEGEEGTANRTMIYLYQYREGPIYGNELASSYPRIDNIKGVVTGKYCKKIVDWSLSVKDSCDDKKDDSWSKNNPVREEITKQSMEDFM